MKGSAVFCLLLACIAAALAQYNPYSPYPPANARGPSASNGASYSRGPSGSPYSNGQSRINGNGAAANGYGPSSRVNGGEAYGPSSRANGDVYGDDSYGGPRASEEDPDADGVAGVAGRDYPTYDQVPQTSFSCQDHQFPGIYADTDPQCQVFHICQFDGRHDSFLCPNGSIFNQQYFVCDWWYNVDCSQAPSFYNLNAQLYQDPSSSRHSSYSNGGDYESSRHSQPDIYGGGAPRNGQVYNGGAQRSNGQTNGGASSVYGGGSRAQSAQRANGGRAGVGGTPVYSSSRVSSPVSPGYPRADTQPAVY